MSANAYMRVALRNLLKRLLVYSYNYPTILVFYTFDVQDVDNRGTCSSNYYSLERKKLPGDGSYARN